MRYKILNGSHKEIEDQLNSNPQYELVSIHPKGTFEVMAVIKIKAPAPAPVVEATCLLAKVEAPKKTLLQRIFG
jgi:hypothetical protein